MDQAYLDIEIKNLRSIIPARLYLILNKHGIRDVRTLLEFTSEEFSNLQGVGTKSFALYENFVLTLSSDQDFVRATDLENRERELPLTPVPPGTGAFLGNFIAIVNDYLSIAMNKREMDVIVKRFRIHDDRFYSLEEIASLHGITRERVRQIEEHALKSLRLLLTGESLQLPYCKCSASALESFRKIKTEIFQKSIQSAADLLEMIWQRYHVGMDDIEERYIVLLLAVWETRELDFRDHLYIITDSELDKKNCLQLFSTIMKILAESIVPVSQEDLISTVRERWRESKNDEKYIPAVVDVFIEAETIMIVSWPHYQLRFEDLKASTDQACRILLEQETPMYYADLSEMINDRLTASGSDKHVDPDSLKGQMCVDGRFAPKGKSGIWRLKYWDEAE